ncbi:DUF1353 domain-containing protein [Pseudomonas sp. DY-1]|uniref:DUF1353 domain-containing protein n=1 Tax=Pseudomonas sp. DY-1 TaxID=1755504 RepID=UPI000EA8F0E8|nr:DUF1353 domain-containing protein [Pseudomonas sp. DY-1]AYF88613.1 DUF1353 domain-containing protein [Pseudomonas sp. DY-1]
MTAFPYFTRPLDLRYDPQASSVLRGEYYRILTGFRLMLSDRQWVDVQAGTLTDGGSIPRLAHPLLPPLGKLGQAYATHDQLCEYLSLTVDGKPSGITRARCDGLLYVAMQVLGATREELAAVQGAVDLYREAARITKPSTIALKRSLEARWNQ